MWKLGRAAPWALLSCVAWHSSAAAGPLETLRSIAFHPSDPATYAAVFNEAGGGLLITHDSGQSFRLACMSYVTGERTIDSLLPQVVYTADGHLVVATFNGLFRDDGHGCGFVRASELSDDYVAGLAVDPSDPTILYALTSSGGQQNGIFRSLDQGASWALFGQLEDAFFRRLDVVPLTGGGQRIYVSLARLQGSSVALTPLVRFSDDEGATFTDYVFPRDSDMTVLGVDAAEPDRIYAAAPDVTGGSATILVNDARGAPDAWRELGSVQALGSFETPPEGGFFVVDLGLRQLLHSNGTQDGLELVDGSEITCFERSPLSGERFSCATFRLLNADSSGVQTAQLVYDMNQLDAFVSCGAQDSELLGSCGPQLDYGWCGATHFPEAPLCLALRGDAGIPVPVANESKASGCTLAPERASDHTLAATSLLLTGLALARRRRSARPQNQAVA